MSYDYIEDAVEKLQESSDVTGIDFLLITLNAGDGNYRVTRNWDITDKRNLQVIKEEFLKWCEKMEVDNG